MEKCESNRNIECRNSGRKRNEARTHSLRIGLSRYFIRIMWIVIMTVSLALIELDINKVWSEACVGCAF